MKQLTVLEETDKHIQKVCEFDKAAKERYKPSSTLNKTIIIQPERKVFTTIEDCNLDPKPAKLIPLMESMNIMKLQEDRVKVKLLTLSWICKQNLFIFV